MHTFWQQRHTREFVAATQFLCHQNSSFSSSGNKEKRLRTSITVGGGPLAPCSSHRKWFLSSREKFITLIPRSDSARVIRSDRPSAPREDRGKGLILACCPCLWRSKLYELRSRHERRGRAVSVVLLDADAAASTTIAATTIAAVPRLRSPVLLLFTIKGESLCVFRQKAPSISAQMLCERCTLRK